MTEHEIYMKRCLELARNAIGDTAPNPMVGSVLVHEGRIIGEGYHREYGKAHAEVNCLDSVPSYDRDLVSESTLYVSLEPCAHFGKTPPCADLIIRHRIPKIVIGVRDPFVSVNGKGIEKLREAGVKVITGVLEEECKQINQRFFTFHTRHRPFVLLKWAQTADGVIGAADRSRLLISNEATNRLVHRWRSEEMSILVGTTTALYDDPELTTRLWPGKSPIRLVVDMDLSLPSNLKLFTSGHPTVVFNLYRHTLPLEKISAEEVRSFGLSYYQVTHDVSLVHQMMNALYRMGIQSVLVEGGAFLLQSFLDEGIWDEARVITNEQLETGAGLPAPRFKGLHPVRHERIFSDTIRYYNNHMHKE